MLRSPFRATRRSGLVCTVTAHAKAAASAGGSEIMCMSASFLDRLGGMCSTTSCIDTLMH